jgi:hypothetical protein
LPLAIIPATTYGASGASATNADLLTPFIYKKEERDVFNFSFMVLTNGEDCSVFWWFASGAKSPLGFSVLLLLGCFASKLQTLKRSNSTGLISLILVNC